MRSVLLVLGTLVLAAGLAVAQTGAGSPTGERGIGGGLTVLEFGSGPVAAVFVASRASFAPAFAEAVAPMARRFRVIAFVVDGSGLEELGGAEGVAASAASVLDRAGIERACVVSCGDCLPAAVALAERQAAFESLVVMGAPAPAAIGFTKAVFVASDAGASLVRAVESALVRFDAGRGRSAQYRKMIEQ